SFLAANQVDSGPLHGLEVVQADACGNLDANPTSSCSSTPVSNCSDRGDAGDHYPGLTANTAFTATSTPAALRNADGTAAALAIDQITEVGPDGTMQFHLVSPAWVVRRMSTAAALRV